NDRLIEAEGMILKALSIQSGSYAYHTILAGILLQRGRPDDAIREARISLMLNGDQSEPYALFSVAFRMKKDMKTAAHFQKIAEAFRSRKQTQQPESVFQKTM
ncbi:MAG: hypothetical protein D4R93_00975, partial [Deltaproteobacteria bacterium]